MDKTAIQTIPKLLEKWTPAASTLLCTLIFILQSEIGVVQPARAQFHNTSQLFITFNCPITFKLVSANGEVNQKDLNESLGNGLLFLMNLFGALKPRGQRWGIVCFTPYFQRPQRSSWQTKAR